MENYLDPPKPKAIPHTYYYFINDDYENGTENLQLIKDIYYYYYLPKLGKAILYQQDEYGNRTILTSDNFYDNTELIYITLEQFLALMYFICDRKSTEGVNNYWIELACDVVGIDYEYGNNDKAIKEVINIWNNFYDKYFVAYNYNDSEYSTRTTSRAIWFCLRYRIEEKDIENNQIRELNYEWKRRIREQNI